jgi:hypothetical protein
MGCVGSSRSRADQVRPQQYKVSRIECAQVVTHVALPLGS